MKQLIFNILTFFLVSTLVIAQDTDSLLMQVKSNDNHGRLKTYLQLSKIILEDEPKKAEQYASEALSLSKILHLEYDSAYAHFLLGEAHYYQHHFTEAIYHYKLSLDHFENNDTSELVATIISSIGLSQYYQGNYDTSLEFLMRAHDLYTNFNDREGVANSLQNIGLIYYAWEEYDKTLEFYKNALDIFQSLNLQGRLADLYQNIGSIFLHLEKYDQAIDYYNDSYQQFKLLDNKFGIAVSLNNIGLVYEYKEDFNKAKEYYTKSLNLFEAIGHERGLVYCLHNLASIDSRFGNYRQAESYYLRSLEIAQEHELSDNILYVYESLAEMYSDMGNYKKSNDYLRDYIEVNDSVFNESKSQQIHELQTKFESERQKQEIELLNRDNQIKAIKLQRQRFRLFIYFGFGVLGLIIGLVLLARNRAIGKLNSQLEKEVLERKTAQEKLREAHASLEEKIQERTQELNESNKKLQDEIAIRKKSEEDLKIAKEKAEESDRLKSAFLSNMSHEIRTPMNGIMGFSRLLTNDAIPPEKKKEYVSIIQSNGKVLLHLIDDIIDVTRIQLGALPMQPTVFDIQDLMNRLFSFYSEYRTNQRKENIALICANKQYDSFPFFSDANRLHQVFSALIENAFKFTEKGEIQFGYRVFGDEVEFYVKDTGIGIDKKFHEKIFQNFTQIDGSSTREYGGNGLGLTIAKNVVELLGGALKVESQPFEGSRFYFRLPVQNMTKLYDLEEEEQPKKNVDKPFDFSGKNILVAEDIDENYLLIKEFLVNTGAAIYRAHNGIETLKMVEENRIDLILLDIQMPKMDGYQVTLKLRRQNNHVPIIAQTAFSMKYEKNKCLESGCNEYMSKPLDETLMLTLIDKYIGINN